MTTQWRATGEVVPSVALIGARRTVIEREADPPWLVAMPAVGLVLLLLFAAWPFAEDEIEAAVRQEVRVQLDAAGLKWAKVWVRGQIVVLGGMPPRESDGLRALEVAADTRCPTWLGPLRCAFHVDDEFDSVAPPGDSRGTPIAPVRPAASAPASCARALADETARESVAFAEGGAEVLLSSQGLLDRLAAAIKTCPGRVRIEGHYDTSLSAEEARRLSFQRAVEVSRALVRRGIEEDRLLVLGLGSSRPLVTGDSPEIRARNRRVEVRPADSE